MGSENPSKSGDSLVDRPKGFLTKGDKEFLTGVSTGEMSKNAWNQRRFQIRRRARNALIDFNLLSNLPDKDVELIFGNYDSSTQSAEEAMVDLLVGDTYLTHGLIDLFEMLTIGIGPSKTQALFIRGLTSGIDHLGARSDEVLLNYDINEEMITVHEEGHTPLNEIEGKFEQEEDLTIRELDVLASTGRISQEEYIQNYREMFLSGLQEDE